MPAPDVRAWTRRLAITCAIGVALTPGAGAAQDEEEEEPFELRPPSFEPLAPAPAPDDDDATPEEDEAPPLEVEDEAEEAPFFEPALDEEEGALPPPEGPAPAEGELVPTDEEARAAEARAASLQTSDATRFEDTWTAGTPVLTLHGYLRTRVELQDRFHLGRDAEESDDPAGGVPPFTRFRFPEDGGGASGSLIFANMRFRVEPTLTLGEHVRLHAQFDVFDNLILGSEGARAAYDPWAGFTSTARESSIVAKRAWAEVTARGLGQIRFGRMGWHWGQGLLANGGEGIDDDLQTDVDRLMIVTKLASLYWMASWDFVDEGVLSDRRLDLQVPWVDANEGDDTTQFTFAVARRLGAEERLATLARGDVALDAGALFVYRSNSRQFPLDATPVAPGEIPTPPDFDGVDPISTFNRGYEAFIPDVFLDLEWGPLRLGFEAAAVFGRVDTTRSVFDPDDAEGATDLLLRQYGLVFESEIRLLEDNLRFYFDTGFASGDSDTVSNQDLGSFGLAYDNDLFTQRNGPAGDDAVSTFVFHPNYRIDLILWRNIVTRVAGAYYFKPGVSYDFLRSPFGQLLRARLDVVWSRSSNPRQAWNGRSDDLGVEIDVSVLFRTEDGPEVWDGFYAMAQYGFLFALPGLNNPSNFEDVNLENAQTVRLLLGVVY